MLRDNWLIIRKTFYTHSSSPVNISEKTQLGILKVIRLTYYLTYPKRQKEWPITSTVHLPEQLLQHLLLQSEMVPSEHSQTKKVNEKQKDISSSDYTHQIPLSMPLLLTVIIMYVTVINSNNVDKLELLTRVKSITIYN